MNNLSISQIVGNFGAELNVDLKTINSNLLLSLLDQYKVLVIRNQNLSKDEQICIGKKLGNVSMAHPIITGTVEHPEIYDIVSSYAGKNAQWHTDVTYTENPHSISILCADDIPEHGGDTLFCDLETSYNGLSTNFKQYLNISEAVHKVTPLAYVGYPYDHLNGDLCSELYNKSRNHLPIIHPVVRLHPRTNKPNLFVNPGYTTHIKNVSKIESNHILNLLYEHCLQPENILRVKWNVGDVVIWDNTNTMHYATNDYSDYNRKMRRITICGDKPVGYNGSVSRISNDIKDRF